MSSTITEAHDAACIAALDAAKACADRAKSATGSNAALAATCAAAAKDLAEAYAFLTAPEASH
ncbi:hypothetical protein GCM10027059_26620 [Myceligenerans halotolerans]